MKPETSDNRRLQLTLDKREGAILSWIVSFAQNAASARTPEALGDLQVIRVMLAKDPLILDNINNRIITLAKAAFEEATIADNALDAVSKIEAQNTGYCQDGHCGCDSDVCCVCGQVKR